MVDTKTYIKTAVVDLEKRIARIKKNINPCGMICACNWIIRVDGIYITPEFDENNQTISKITFNDPDMVMRFTEGNARNLASIMKNGRGDYGEAVLWVQACEERLEGLESQLECFKKAV